jgi:hypothetical protein
MNNAVAPIKNPINTFLSSAVGMVWYQELFSENNIALKKQADTMNMPRPRASCR